MSEPDPAAVPRVASPNLSTAAMAAQPDPDRVIPRKQVISWALWDWATQPFNTVLLTFVWVPSFLVSPFFLDPTVAARGVVDGDTMDCDTTANTLTEYCRALGGLDANLGWGITVAGILIALLAPVLGQRADATGHRKLMLGIFTGLLIACQLGDGVRRRRAVALLVRRGDDRVRQHRRRDRRRQQQLAARLRLDAEDGRAGLRSRVGIRLPRRHRRARDRRRPDPRRGAGRHECARPSS